MAPKRSIDSLHFDETYKDLININNDFIDMDKDDD